MEAQDCSLFKSGTSNAQKFTLAFWVKSSYTGAAQVIKVEEGENKVYSEIENGLDNLTTTF